MWQGLGLPDSGSWPLGQKSRRSKLQKLFGRFARQEIKPKWVGVLDSSILVGAAIARHPESAVVKVVEAAISGLYDCVLSESIREESLTVLARMGFSDEIANAMYESLWQCVHWVDLAADSPELLKVVHDPNDVHVLRCALGVFETVPDLAERSRKFLISENTQDFKPERNYYGWQFTTAHLFWQRLMAVTESDEAALERVPPKAE
jgi:predicted nucleic acid-binding protein